jgi:cytochrome P450/predicted unusual protein kinase regulating ubiquinone biosynthesis (AarF/ABC1/UbiB family)
MQDRLVGDTLAADLAVAELLTTAGLADPYARLERIRAIGRAVPSSLGLVVTGYDDCQHALRNSALVSDAEATFQPLLGETWRQNRSLKLLADSLLFLEGAAHNRVRRLVASAFTPAAVTSWQPTIDAVVNELLVDVAIRLQRGERVDLVASLARPLPIAIMAELIGLPRADATRLRTLVGTIAELGAGLVLDEEALRETHAVGVELDNYLRTALSTDHATADAPTRADEATMPNRSSVMGRIALDTNDAVSEDDRVSLAFILLAAGFETTAMLVANAISLLIDNPHEWTKLIHDPDYAQLTIEETLRLQAPAAFTARVAAEPTTVGGVSIAKGEGVTMFLAAANRDPEKFANASTFDPSRYADSKSATAPLSFGSGMHHCIGSVLARAEAVAVLRRIGVLGSPSHIALAEPVTWRPTAALRGVESLIVAAKRADAKNAVDSSDAPGGSELSIASPDATTTRVTNVITNARTRRRATNDLMRGLISGFVGSKIRAVFARGARKQEIKEAFAAESSAKAVEVMGDLKGVTMKMGQMASFLGTTMPDVAKRSLVALQANAPAMAEGEAEAAIERALGKRVDQLFAEWSPKPVAAASIGQVHRARLHDGREVAVKVQYPGVAEAIDNDLKDQARMTKLLSRFAMRSLDAETLSREIGDRISQELDFINEAQHQREFAARYVGHPFIKIPDVVSECSTRTILTSTWVEGVNWATFLEQATQTEKDRAGEIIARFMFGSTRRYQHFNADPNPGNFLFHPNAQHVTFLDFGLTKKVSPEKDKQMWIITDSLIDATSPEEISRGCIEGGYLKEDHGLDLKLLARYMRTSNDFYDHEPFTVTTEWLAPVMKTTFTFDNGYSVIRTKLSTQADYFLRDRIYFGMLGILAELNATASWKPMHDEYRKGTPPSTELGEQESAWRKSAVT